METLNEWFKNHDALSSVFSTLFIGMVALAITWIYSAKSKKISEDEIFYNLYSKFNERYDKINDILQELYIANLANQITIEELKNDSRLHSACIDFFNICAEEHYWNPQKKNRKGSLGCLELWYE
jgi:hypothetical protein